MIPKLLFLGKFSFFWFKILLDFFSFHFTVILFKLIFILAVNNNKYAVSHCRAEEKCKSALHLSCDAAIFCNKGFFTRVWLDSTPKELGRTIFCVFSHTTMFYTIMDWMALNDTIFLVFSHTTMFIQVRLD